MVLVLDGWMHPCMYPSLIYRGVPMEGETQNTERDALEAALHRVGVHDGFPDHRRRLAVALHIEGFSPDDVDVLAAGIASQRRRDSDSVPAIVAKILSDPKTARIRVADMKRGQELRASGPQPLYPGQSYWKSGTDDGFTGRDSARDRRIAYALIVSDRRPAREAAEIIGCTESEAIELAEKHRLANQVSTRRDPKSSN